MGLSIALWTLSGLAAIATTAYGPSMLVAASLLAFAAFMLPSRERNLSTQTTRAA